MPKRAAGQGNIAHHAGNSQHQKEAHALLTEHGFEFVRRSGGHGSNVYEHPDGRRVSVTSTPRDNDVALQYLRQAIRSPRLGLKAGESPPTKKESPVSTTTVTPVTLLLSMADPYLLKTPDSRKATQARNYALTGWMKRALEKHGPVRSGDLTTACKEMGFGNGAINAARLGANVQAWTVPGAGKGKGKGQNPTWVSLLEQVPLNASIIGRHKAPDNGVAAVTGEDDTQATEPPVVTEVVGVPVVENFIQADPAPGPLFDKPLDASNLKPLTVKEWPAEQPFAPEQSQGVTAAAQMLLDELGLKTLDPQRVESVRAAADRLDEAQSALNAAIADLQHALRMLT